MVKHPRPDEVLLFSDTVDFLAGIEVRLGELLVFDH